jgi:hypothetical protein
MKVDPLLATAAKEVVLEKIKGDDQVEPESWELRINPVLTSVDMCVRHPATIRVERSVAIL